MPLEKLSTGIDLYYESQGRGEAVVFIPGTGFSGNVWMETQVEPLSRSLQVIVHVIKRNQCEETSWLSSLKAMPMAPRACR